MRSPVVGPPGSWLHRFALLTAAATLALIGVGGLVTSHGVGMAVPDWPNTYGYNVFFFPISRWVGGIFYEHSHRLVASGVGLLTSVLALWLYGHRARPFMRWTGVLLLLLSVGTWLAFPARWSDAVVLGITGLSTLGASYLWPRSEPAPKWLRRLGLVAFVTVVLQGVLGGLRVTEHKDEIGIFHATLAQLFFVLICSLALFTSRKWRFSAAAPGTSLRPSTFGLFLATTLLVLAQLILGATMRHQHAGLAIPDFPLAYGRLWPAMDPNSVALYNQRRLEVTAENAITGTQVALQMAHRFLAATILCAVAGCAWVAARRHGWKNFAGGLGLFWLGLIWVQVLLGAATIWSNKAADIATGHVLVGALSLATGAILCILSARELVVARELEGLSTVAENLPRSPFGSFPSAATQTE